MRKIPKQSRSKALVAAITEATARILPKIGSQNLTTNKVAEIAGVSIGSLYQYFPNKEALLGAVIDLALETTARETGRLLDQIKGLPLDEAIDLIVDHTVNLFLVDRQKTKETFIKARELQRFPIMFEIRHQVILRIADLMEYKYPGLPKSDYEMAAFNSTSAILGIVDTVVFDESRTFQNEDIAKEMKLLLKAYLNRKLSV